MTFERAFAITIGEEGGESNNPADRGGHTYRGVTQRRFTAWITQNGKFPELDRDVITMTDAELITLAKIGYWNAAHCDDCPERTGCLHFDAAFNHGPANAIGILQRALGVEVDHVYGPITFGVLSKADDGVLLDRYFDSRKAFFDRIIATDPYKNDPLLTQQNNYAGWMARLTHLRKALA